MGIVSRLLGAFGAAKQAVRGMAKRSSNGRKIVFDVKRQSFGDLAAQDRHEQRKTGDVTHVVKSRAHLNERSAYGDHLLEPSKAVEAYIKDKDARIDPRNITPCTSFVLSASHDWFKGDGPDGFNEQRVNDWSAASVGWLQDTFGEDVVHVSLHMDEKTPHIHAKVVPITQRTTKRGTVVRQVSHHGHPAFRGRRSYARLLSSYAAAVEPLGLERGDEAPEGARADARTARQWTADQARAVARDRAKVDQERSFVDHSAQIIEQQRLDLIRTREELEKFRIGLTEQAQVAVADLERAEKPVSAPTRQLAQSQPSPAIPPRVVPPPRDWTPPATEKRARRKTTRQSRDDER